MPGVFEPRSRRARSAIDGPQQQRARQRDAAGLTSRYTYVYTPAEMAVWLAWYRDELLAGRRWFAHALPGRGGLAQRVVRYRSVRQQLLGAGLYRVSAEFEQRGASLLPVAEESDPFFADVVLLLHYDGNYVDVKGHTIYVTGSPGFSSLPEGPVLTGEHSWFGGGTAPGGGGNARLYTEFSSDFDLNGSDFTIEQWSYIPSANSRPRAFVHIADDSEGYSGNGASEYLFGTPGGPVSNFLRASFPSSSTTETVMNNGELTFGTWQHSFFQRRLNVYTYGLAGIIESVNTGSYRRHAGPKRVFIGQETITLDVDGFYGYLAETRVTRAARYDGQIVGVPYDVPSYPFPDS